MTEQETPEKGLTKETAPLEKAKLTFHTNWKISTFVALMLPCLISLGFWQLDRADEKRAVQAVFDLRQTEKPISIESLFDQQAVDLKSVRVSLKGRYINSNNILIDNKIYHSKFGYEVVTPFKLSTSGRLILVNRGWIQGHSDRRIFPDIDEIQKEQTVEGVIFIPSKTPFSLGTPEQSDAWPKRVPFINHTELVAYFDAPLFPHQVRLDTQQAGELQRNWKVITVKPEKHTGYAVQWFAMAFTLALLYLALSTNLLGWSQNKQ
ncbi:MAG: hypothetical protein COB51_10905 [Moraxellaceae bacterium]|nr:MAG: hypothetical protein COB51_10905 [Moraxellaceae bacterium]